MENRRRRHSTRRLLRPNRRRPRRPPFSAKKRPPSHNTADEEKEFATNKPTSRGKNNGVTHVSGVVYSQYCRQQTAAGISLRQSQEQGEKIAETLGVHTGSTTCTKGSTGRVRFRARNIPCNQTDTTKTSSQTASHTPPPPPRSIPSKPKPPPTASTQPNKKPTPDDAFAAFFGELPLPLRFLSLPLLHGPAGGMGFPPPPPSSEAAGLVFGVKKLARVGCALATCQA